jgi:hypothetical protein
MVRSLSITSLDLSDDEIPENFERVAALMRYGLKQYTQIHCPPEP